MLMKSEIKERQDYMDNYIKEVNKEQTLTKFWIFLISAALYPYHAFLLTYIWAWYIAPSLGLKELAVIDVILLTASLRCLIGIRPFDADIKKRLAITLYIKERPWKDFAISKAIPTVLFILLYLISLLK